MARRRRKKRRKASLLLLLVLALLVAGFLTRRILAPRALRYLTAPTARPASARAGSTELVAQHQALTAAPASSRAAGTLSEHRALNEPVRRATE
jgi:hypothetical protein